MHESLAARLDGHLPHEGVIASYVAIGAEIDPTAFAALRPETAFAYPWFEHRDAPMRFRQGRGVEPGPFRIPQPIDGPFVAPAIVLAPLLATDRLGNRLGQGAGHYDRALAQLRASGPFTVIGLAYDIQLVDGLPADPWDIPLDAIATPSAWIDTAARAPRRPPMPSLRKPLGVLAIIAGLALYALLIASLADRIGRLPVLAQALVYLALGIVWVLPLRPLLVWMESGRR